MEDDWLVARSLSLCLAKAGAEGRIHQTVAEAQALRASWPFYDGWIIDIRLPDGSGLDLLAAVRTAGVTAPAMVWTALGGDGYAHEAARLGALFVPKGSVDSRQLSALLAWALRLRDSERAPAVALEQAVLGLAAGWCLSHQQSHLVLLRCRGLRTRKELAPALGVAEETVKTHVQRVLRKTGCATLDDVAARVYAVTFGELPPSPVGTQGGGTRL